jgi:YD repeat-containing protein
MFSAAFNNAECLEGSADPKTGSYSFRHTFGTVQSDGKFGPKCNLTMSFGFLSTMDTTNPTGLGNGWSFKLGSYSSKSDTITLNSGESHQVLYDSNTKPWKLSHKLKGLEVRRHREGADDQIHVHHKNGDLEIMDVNSHSKDAVLTRFTSANGRFLRFKYSRHLQYYRLTSVYDGDNTLASIHYSDRQVEVITHPDAQKDKCVTKLYLNNSGFLYKLELPDKEKIHFDYHSIKVSSNGSTINPMKRVTYSSGAVEEMEYRKELLLPRGAPFKYMPAITKHTKKVKTLSSAEQPIITRFTYCSGNHNYWGGGNNSIAWGSNKDSLFNCNSRYRYSSETKCGDKITKCEYNKFHQIVSKVETNGNDNHKILTNYEYYSDEHGVLDDQPTIYELAKKEATYYERDSKTSQEFVKTYQYDEWGNVTEETTASGIRIVSEYYLAEGEKGCPKHPFGMRAFVKKRSHYPIDDASQCKSDSFTYQSIPGTNAIVPLSMSHGNLTKSYTYFDSSTPKVLGVPKSEVVTVGGKATTTSWNYEFQGDFIVLTDTVTAHDGKSLSRSRKLSYWTGLVCSEKDGNGVVTTYTRDKSGRLLSETTGLDTAYKVTTTYKYEENSRDPDGNQRIGFKVEQATDTGATVHTFYDAEHNELAAYQKDEQGTMRKLSEKQYDDQERLVSESEFDYITGEVEKTMCKKTVFKFDTWGHKSETHHDNGTVDVSISDPIALTTTQQTRHKDGQSLHKVVSTQDKYGNHISTEIFTPDGQSYSKSIFTYDSFGRKRSFTTPTGHTATITEFDQLDRPTEFVHYDSTKFRITYADFSTENLVSSMSVPALGYTLCEREYDGLSRTISTTVNGAKTCFGYKGGYDRPSSQVNAKGNTSLFNYIPALDMQVSQAASFTSTVSIDAWEDASKVSESIFTYSQSNDASHGSILSAKNANSQYSYSYTKSGFVKAVTQTVGGKSHTVTTLKKTMADKPLLVKVGDRMVSYEYDNLGDVASITDGDIKVELGEDVFGRLSSKVVKQKNPTTGSYELVQTTLTNYDEHSRETTRNISLN